MTELYISFPDFDFSNEDISKGFNDLICPSGSVNLETLPSKLKTAGGIRNYLLSFLL